MPCQQYQKSVYQTNCHKNSFLEKRGYVYHSLCIFSYFLTKRQALILSYQTVAKSINTRLPWTEETFLKEFANQKKWLSISTIWILCMVYLQDIFFFFCQINGTSTCIKSNKRETVQEIKRGTAYACVARKDIIQKTATTTISDLVVS